MNKALIESYLRNLAGGLLLAITVVMGSTGVASPIDFGTVEWLLVANALWTSAVPTILRWVNKNDPAFGMVAEAVTSSVTKKLEEAVKVAEEKPAPKKVAETTKVAPKKVTPKKK